MKERPILFSAPMVRALLAGTKTQTRRAVSRGNSVLDWDGNSLAKWGGLDLSIATAFSAQTKGASVGSPAGVVSLHALASGLPGYRPGEHTSHRIYPRWRPGDRLWVKETFGLHAYLDFTDWHRGSIRGEIEDDIRERFAVAYRADHYDKDHAAWRPWIFMPRWASRITLEITEVRVQRLQSISEEDAIAEGVEATSPPDLLRYRDYLPEREAIRSSWTHARDSFLSLWESINGTASLAADPWVWALTFKRVTP